MATLTATTLTAAGLSAPPRHTALLGGCGALLVICFFAGAGSGAVTLSPGTIAAILADQTGIDLPWQFTAREQAVLVAIRLPRVCLGALVGAALAVSGAALQGLFRNPLADPGLIGVATGAAVAAASVIVFGGTAVTLLPPSIAALLLPVAAFCGGLIATLLVYVVASRDGHTDVATLLLAGVALNAIAAAGLGLLVFVSTDAQLRDLNFWLLGSLGGITWVRLLPVIPVLAASALLLLTRARPLNALLLGETEALHLGVDVQRNKQLIIVLAALATGAGVALTGVIGFVGLVVPHLIRLLAGPDHRVVLPASILLGASLMLVADLVARTLVLPAELPVGILTSCVGGPFFLWLLLRYRTGNRW